MPSDEYGDSNVVEVPLENVKMSVSTKADKKARRNLLNHAMAKSMMKGNFDSSIELMSTKSKSSKLDFPRFPSQLSSKPQTLGQLSSKLNAKKTRNQNKSYSNMFLNTH